MAAPDVALRQVAAASLGAAETSTIRQLLREAFEDYPDGFTDDDWEHARGGTHFLLEDGAVVLAYASVARVTCRWTASHFEPGTWRPWLPAGTSRDTDTARPSCGRSTSTSEARLSWAPEHRDPDFYRRLGWELWLGSTAVRTNWDLVPTPDDDGGIMVLPTPTTPPLDRHAAISCEWRPGDVW